MSTLREMSQLLPAAVLALAMLFITLDIAVSADPATKSPSAIVEIAGETAMPGRTVGSAALMSDASDKKIDKLAD
jgi:hypothetical protein